MSPDRSWVFASGNRGKLAEIEALLEGTGIALTLQSELGIGPAEETGATFVENALIKARHACRIAERPTIADDSGLVVDALGGRPGVHSARFAGPGASDADNVDKLLAALADVPSERRTARFYCVLVAMQTADDPMPRLAVGQWEGGIAASPRGTGGFGYDPVFVDLQTGLTAAELSSVDKNRRSHRALALRSLRALMTPA